MSTKDTSKKDSSQNGKRQNPMGKDAPSDNEATEKAKKAIQDLDLRSDLEKLKSREVFQSG